MLFSSVNYKLKRSLKWCYLQSYLFAEFSKNLYLMLSSQFARKTRWKYTWFATTWQGGPVGGKYNNFFSRGIYMKIEFSSQMGEMLICSWPPTKPPWRHVQTSNRPESLVFCLKESSSSFLGKLARSLLPVPYPPRECCIMEKKIFVCANRGWIPSYDLIIGMSLCEFWHTNTLLTLFFNGRSSWEKGFIETPNTQSPDHELMIEMGRYNYNQTTKDNRHCPLRGSELIEDVRRRLLWSHLAGPSAFSQKMGQLTFEPIVLKKARSLSKLNCLISSQFFILNVTFSYF